VRYLVSIFFLLLTQLLNAQQDSSLRKDSTVVPGFTIDTAIINVLPDSLIAKPPAVFPKKFDSIVYAAHPFFRFTDPVRRMELKRIPPQGKEDLFYSVIALLLFFAIIRNSFRRYFTDLFRILFRSNLQQRQAREQLMQSPMPSLLLNILFVISASMFLNLVLRKYHLGENFSFWALFYYCLAALTTVYIIKFITLKLFGWVFKLTEATDTYTFIVFTVNKIAGILLMPFIIVMAFTSGLITQFCFTLSLILLGALFIFRYYISYATVHRQVRLNFFHFLLYLFALEIIPLLLINKLLFGFLS
jgi:hypothetical protein